MTFCTIYYFFFGRALFNRSVQFFYGDFINFVKKKKKLETFFSTVNTLFQWAESYLTYVSYIWIQNWDSQSTSFCIVCNHKFTSKIL